MADGGTMSITDGRKSNGAGPFAGVYTIPNVLSISRGLLGPIVMALITYESWWTLSSALALMIVAELSDFIDGIVARRFKQQTDLGRVIDPICDSIYHLSVFLAFLYVGWMPVWMLVLIYARDLTVPYIRTFARQAGVEINVRDSGKLKTAVHAVAQIGVVAVPLNLVADAFAPGIDTVTALLLAATAASLYSLVDYALAASRLARN
jgi:CDP-diacylglycerol--glycerol-3-phosphate 3-phosphatidyltransferase